MKKYAISYSGYVGDEPGMYLIEAKDLRGLLLELLDYDDDGETLEELKKTFDAGNGDGQPYLMALDIETEEQVLG